MDLIIKFIFLTGLVSGTIIFFLHRALISGTEGAVKRLNEEIEKTNRKQAELAQKIKEADEELAKRQAEAKRLTEQMRTEAEEQSKAEREKIVAGARHEGEEIIAKAQVATQKLKLELEKEMDAKAVNFGMQLLNTILSEEAKGALDEILVTEFTENLKNIDMSKINPDIDTVEIITLNPLSDSVKQQLSQIIKGKLKRELTVKSTVDNKIGGGVLLKFGSMALDGSIRNLIREKALGLTQQIEQRVL